MNIFGMLQSALFIIMNALLYPVMALIVYLFGVILFYSGSFAFEFIFRRKIRRDDMENLVIQISNDLTHNNVGATQAKELVTNHLSSIRASEILKNFLKSLLVMINKGRDNLDVRIENLLQEYEIKVSKLLDKTRILVRLGPILGLMGTLIPMGGALLALSQGDLTPMAENLVIAFSTTVVGLAVGAVAFVITVYRERWYEEDMKSMEYLSEMMMKNISNRAGEKQ